MIPSCFTNEKRRVQIYVIPISVRNTLFINGISTQVLHFDHKDRNSLSFSFPISLPKRAFRYNREI